MRGYAETVVSSKFPQACLKGSTLYFTVLPEALAPIGDINEAWIISNSTYSSDNLPPWHSCNSLIRKVVFETSFNQFSPKSTAYWFYGCSSL